MAGRGSVTDYSKVNRELSTSCRGLVHCFSCNKLLLLATFRCDNRHVACYECSNKVEKMKCTACSSSIRKCNDIEVIVDSINALCPNFSLGCKDTIPYSQLNTHQQSCIYAPCSCPAPKCTFLGPMSQLSSHISSEHSPIYKVISCLDCHLLFSQKDDPIRVLQVAKNGPLFLVLNDCRIPFGNSLSVVSLRAVASTEEPRFRYRISADGFIYIKGQPSRFTLEAPLQNIFLWNRDYNPTKNFLFLPHDYCVPSPSHSPSFAVYVHIEEINYPRQN